MFLSSCFLFQQNAHPDSRNCYQVCDFVAENERYIYYNLRNPVCRGVMTHQHIYRSFYNVFAYDVFYFVYACKTDCYFWLRLH